MSRIVAGVAGGRTLTSVPGSATRPTTDRVKEALFSRLEAWDVLQDAAVLDLFAGSGALGVEAASRGAASVQLVDQALAAYAVCTKNAALVNKAVGADCVRAVRSGVEQFLARYPGGEAQWDLVFLDPPYPLTDEELHKVLGALGELLRPGAVVVVERSTRSPQPHWPGTMQLVASKKYGETTLWFAEPATD